MEYKLISPVVFISGACGQFIHTSMVAPSESHRAPSDVTRLTFYMPWFGNASIIWWRHLAMSFDACFGELYIMVYKPLNTGSQEAHRIKTPDFFGKAIGRQLFTIVQSHLLAFIVGPFVYPKPLRCRRSNTLHDMRSILNFARKVLQDVLHLAPSGCRWYAQWFTFERILMAA